jgi:hypothetical protein
MLKFGGCVFSADLQTVQSIIGSAGPRGATTRHGPRATDAACFAHGMVPVHIDITNSYS